MQDKFRRQYQVAKEVARNGYFEGEIPLSNLKRITEMLHPNFDLESSMVTLKFEFLRIESNLSLIEGQLETSLMLECQRCLGSLEKKVVHDFRLMIDASDELVQESSLDTLYSDDGYIDIAEVVEEELILGIPLVVMHEDELCNEHLNSSDSFEAEVKENPFSVLKQLKTTD
jgi:uncharacterized protein